MLLQPASFRVLLAALALGTALPPSYALAQSDEQRAAARDLATEGADAFDQGRYEDAIDRFTRAESLVHAAPHLLYLGRSYAKLRQFVKAREAYLRILNESLPPNAPQAAREAQSAAQNEIAVVEAKIGRLTVQVEGKEQAKDLVVTVNGTPIPGVLVGAPQPVDPGDHRVEASAPGFRAEPQAVTIGEGEKKQVVLTLASDGTAPAPVAGTPGQAGAVADTPPGSEPSTGGGSNGLRIGAYAALGVGAIGVGVGTVFLIQSASKRSEADDLCKLDGGACSTEDRSKVNALDSDADSAATLGIVGLAVGGVALATGVTLFVLSSSGKSDAAGVEVTPWVGWKSAGVSGRF